MMVDGGIGERELELLRYLAAHGPLSVGEVVDSYGASAGLARSTVLTMMERLRKKGHLRRRRTGGIYQYHSPVKQKALLARVIGKFVGSALGGSVSPFVAYLADREELTEGERAQLQAIAERLDSKGGGES
jgi:predicted transcriptional regulator